MTEKRPIHKRPTPEQLDERVKIPLPPGQAIEAILKVDPEAELVDEKQRQRARDRSGRDE